jgi:uncharacterized protein (DUF2141 family)
MHRRTVTSAAVGGNEQRRRTPALWAWAFGLAIVTAWPARAADVDVTVAGVNGAAGHVRVALCTRSTFLKPDCPYSASAPAREGETIVTVTGVEPGEYAAEAFYDDTDAGVVHQDRLGVPREGVGFSRDAPLHLTGPKFGDAAFPVEQGRAAIRLKLRYLSAADWERARRGSAASQ